MILNLDNILHMAFPNNKYFEYKENQAKNIQTCFSTL